MIKKTAFALAAALTLALAPAALAQSGHDAHAGHGSHGAAAGPATEAFKAANARMHAGMDIAFTGDADVDFVRGMIAHHEGAIDMAKILLEHGKDPELRKLAEAIIAAQEDEVAMMRGWLAAKGLE